MEQESFKTKHALAHKLLITTGFAITVATSVLVVPRLVDKFSGYIIKNSASIDISDEGPEIVRNDSVDER